MQHQRDNVVPLPELAKHTKYLKQFGFKPPRWVHVDIVLPWVVLLFAIVLGYLIHGTYEGIEIKGTDVAIASAGLGALLVGYWQWRKARHEISMDKYYERLDIANRRQDGNHLDVHKMMRASTPEIAGETSDVVFYIYAELDNLEYVIEKYRQGFMDPDQACRGLRTFQLRCWSEQFRLIARHRVTAGDYNPRTREVVEKVCKKIDDVIASQYHTTARSERRKTPPGPTSPKRREEDRFPREVAS